jgi:Chemotaxis protein histidine kinase and related kinases
MNEYVETYIAEAKELLDEINGSLLELEQNVEDIGLINSVFRAAHTIKGNSAALAFKRMEILTHSMEDLLQDIRDGKIRIDAEIIELLFACHDFLENGLYSIITTGNEEEWDIEGILTRLHGTIEAQPRELEQENHLPADTGFVCMNMTLNQKELSSLKDYLTAGFNVFAIKISIRADCPFKPVRIWTWFREMEAYLYSIKSQPEEPDDNDVKDSSYVCCPDNVVEILAASKCDGLELEDNLRKLVDAEAIEIQAWECDNRDLSRHQFRPVTTEPPALIAAGAEKPLPGQTEHQPGTHSGKPLENSFMRISTQKIDCLVDMLGELLILHSLMEQEAFERFDANDKYMNNLLRMAKVIKSIQNLSMSLRMVSLKQVLQKTMRAGRDTAAELGKPSTIAVLGEETEIDRNIADKLVDPLLHLVRNSISHGIESEEERADKGKPQAGNINICAYSKRGYVYVEIEDDGCGLDLDLIRTKAAAKNLIDPNLVYSPEEIMKIIFLPGFSTRETVDNVSGRGVGMNVVETEIKKVGGKIDIYNKPGEGCKFVIKIPLNLAVMNGTIVEIAGGRYIIPTLYIKQFMKPDDAQWLKVKNKKAMVRVRDEIIQVIPVDKILGMELPVNEEYENMVVILEVDRKFKALPVRRVIGRQEIVAKPLGKELAGLDYAAGASILGNGKVALILDVETIFKLNDSYCH